MADLPPNIKDAIFDLIGEGELKPEEGELELRLQLRHWLDAGGHLAGKSPAEVEQAIDSLGVAPLNQPVDASLFGGRAVWPLDDHQFSDSAIGIRRSRPRQRPAQWRCRSQRAR